MWRHARWSRWTLRRGRSRARCSRAVGLEAARQAAIERANAKLPEFQRITRWVLWPEPDLPRTSTGKVRRKPVAEWLARVQSAAATPSTGNATTSGDHAFGPSSDWLLTLIAQITGEALPGVGDELRLTEDFHLDSLGRVQLASAIEERLGIVSGTSLLEEVQTLGDLRRVVAGGAAVEAQQAQGAAVQAVASEADGNRQEHAQAENAAAPEAAPAAVEPQQAVATVALPQGVSAAPGALRRPHFIYPEWPWWKPFQWIRAAFVEAVLRPGTWLLVKPRVFGPVKPLPKGPLLIVANHVTSYDGDLIVYALPGPYRRRMAAAMLGEMLDDFRHWRNPWKPGDKGFYIFGPPAYYLVTALFNVYPLPRQRDFQRSFAHAGKALDHGYNVLVFPEGTLSPDGKMAKFRSGIGLLVKQSYVPVLPVAMRGLGEAEDAPAPLVPFGDNRNPRGRGH